MIRKPKNFTTVGRSSATLLVIYQIFTTLLLTACNCDPIIRLSEECQYPGDMARVSPECIRRMRDDQILIRECEGVYYGPGLLYTDREATEFWITIHELDRPEYADALTYSIYSKTGDFNEPGSLKWIEDCKSLDLKSKCILPKRKKGETHYIYFPIKSDKYEEYWYCEFEIEEYVYNPRPRFCENEWEYECLVIEDGVVRMKTLFIPLMNGTVDSRYEYCVFSASDDYLANYDGRREEAIHNTKGIKRNGRRKIVMTHQNGTKSHRRCTIMENRRRGNIFHKAEAVLGDELTNSDGICFFVKMPGTHARWTKKPVCYRRNPHHRNRVRVQ